MIFKNISDAKEYVVQVTNKARTIDQINSSIEYYQSMVDSANSDESRSLWESEVEKLKLWKNSDDFKDGSYPQGIDELILEVIEWRSVQAAFQEIETEKDLFKHSGFFA